MRDSARADPGRRPPLVLTPLASTVGTHAERPSGSRRNAKARTTPAVIAASAVLGTVGSGAATRAGSVVWFLWVGFVGLRLLRVAQSDRWAVPRRA